MAKVEAQRRARELAEENRRKQEERERRESEVINSTRPLHCGARAKAS